jgi:chromosome segregation ATPase
MSGKSMNQVRNEEQSLGRLLSDIEELERTRAALLKRIESARSLLLDAGNRTGTIRASAELLWDHIADAAAAAEELALLEREIRDVEQDVDQFSREAAGLTFETESLKETLDEADEELERLSAILIERKTKTSKGH